MKNLKYLLYLIAILTCIFLGSSCQDGLIFIDDDGNGSAADTTDTTSTTDTTGNNNNNNNNNNGTALTANYYVAPGGSDSNAGTIDKPFKTMEYAYERCTSGNELIYMRAGTYTVSSKTSYYGFELSGKNGKDASNRIKIWAYPGEVVNLDCSGMTASDDGIVGLYIGANNIHLKGINVMKMPQNRDASGYGYYNVGILVKANNVTLENCTSHDNGGTGINIGGFSTGTLLRNCDSYNNYDPYTYLDNQAWPGGNADGFHITVSGKETSHKLVGCRAWNNSDDGYDCYGTDGIVNMDSCWSFHNGYLADNSESTGDGEGFKLGQTASVDALHKTISHCLAVYNKMEGISQNHSYVVMLIKNNTCYGNGAMQFDFPYQLNGTQNTLSNNIAVGTNYIKYGTQTNNSWQLNVTANANDFLSTDMSLLKESRQSNGNQPLNSAFHLVSGSDLTGLGAF